MANPSDLTRLVPGFDFLQNLMKGAGAGIPGIPGMSQWIAPTINPEEIEKRISELKTVQFWLENNARLLATTIQALEVQRMTLSTLQTMNLPLADLAHALKINVPGSAPSGRGSAGAGQQEERQERQAQQEQADEQGDDESPAKQHAAASKPAPRKAAGGAAKAPGAIDPMQWWGALTQQFTELATNALKDGGAQTPGSVAGSGAEQTGTNTARTPKKTASVPTRKAAPARKRSG